MQIKTIARLLGLLLMMFSLSMLTPLIINFIFNEVFWLAFVSGFGCTFLMGGVLWFMFRKHRAELKARDGFLIVVLFWFVLCFFAALPFLFAMDNEDSLTDAIFESVSGFTTTGASVIAQIDVLPHSILFYRQQLQFFGGMGIVVLAVAILPMLGVGGMQLYRAETPGTMKDTKLTPRITHTAKALWFIYFTLTILCIVSYWFAGMSWFDALGEGLTSVSTGGFSMHQASFAYYRSDLIELIASLFMLLGGMNFALHFIAFKKLSISYYLQDEEFRYYLIYLILAIIIICLSMVGPHFSHLNRHLIVQSVFNVVSFATTTGFASNYTLSWPFYSAFLLLLLGIVGGCAASTSGGIKFVRALLLYKQSRREIIHLLHPTAVIPLKFGKHTVSETMLHSMWSFIAIFIALFLILMVVFMALGNDFATTFSAITATLANVGAGAGNLNVDFINLSIPSKWLLIFTMIAGRLEIFSLLILFTRHFWLK